MWGHDVRTVTLVQKLKNYRWYGYELRLHRIHITDWVYFNPPVAQYIVPGKILARLTEEAYWLVSINLRSCWIVGIAKSYWSRRIERTMHAVLLVQLTPGWPVSLLSISLPISLNDLAENMRLRLRSSGPYSSPACADVRADSLRCSTSAEVSTALHILFQIQATSNRQCQS